LLDHKACLWVNSSACQIFPIHSIAVRCSKRQNCSNCMATETHTLAHSCMSSKTNSYTHVYMLSHTHTQINIAAQRLTHCTHCNTLQHTTTHCNTTQHTHTQINIAAQRWQDIIRNKKRDWHTHTHSLSLSHTEQDSWTYPGVKDEKGHKWKYRPGPALVCSAFVCRLWKFGGYLNMYV